MRLRTKNNFASRVVESIFFCVCLRDAAASIRLQGSPLVARSASSDHRSRPFFPATDVQYRREIVDMPDGDFIVLDWSEPEPMELNAPVLVHFHGLEGDSHSITQKR